MLKWSSTPTLTLMRYHSLVLLVLNRFFVLIILAQKLASPPNRGVALHGAGFMVRVPHVERNLFRGSNQPTALSRTPSGNRDAGKTPRSHTWLKSLSSVSALWVF